MTWKRGNIALSVVPFSSGLGSKKRPVVVVQSDLYNRRISNVVVALITSKLSWAADPCHVLIDVTTPEGKASGLLRNSLVSCINLIPLDVARLERVIGSLSPSLMQQVDDALKIALALK